MGPTGGKSSRNILVFEETRQTMTNPDQSTASMPAGTAAGDCGPEHPWEACVLPLAVFLAVGLFEPMPGGGGLAGPLRIPFAAYPLVYTLRLVATLLALALARQPIRHWLGRPTWWPALAGLALAVPWIILAGMQRDAGWTTAQGGRAAFDPFVHLANRPAAAWAFLAVRAVGLVAVVPLRDPRRLLAGSLRHDYGSFCGCLCCLCRRHAPGGGGGGRGLVCHRQRDRSSHAAADRRDPRPCRNEPRARDLRAGQRQLVASVDGSETLKADAGWPQPARGRLGRSCQP